ncbi:PP2C family serine/threonine-protein phosphatase [Candidatus Riflebacteria bacterium]
MNNFRFIGKSVRGFRHIKHGVPNQDSILCHPENLQGPPLCLALADGHGSSKCFRSERGARIATEIACQCLLDFYERMQAGPLNGLRNKFASRVAEKWRDRVREDMEKDRAAFERELDSLAQQKGADCRLLLKQNPFISYGTTLLAALLSENSLFFWQLGDGDILLVNSSGEVKRAIEKDSRLLGNETSSLCQRDCATEFRTSMYELQKAKTVLVLLCSDGYANSFKSEQDFLQIGTDYYSTLKDEGVAELSANLEQWLAETSREGSGDDISLGLIFAEDYFATGRYKR